MEATSSHSEGTVQTAAMGCYLFDPSCPTSQRHFEIINHPTGVIEAFPLSFYLPHVMTIQSAIIHIDLALPNLYMAELVCSEGTFRALFTSPVSLIPGPLARLWVDTARRMRSPTLLILFDSPRYPGSNHTLDPVSPSLLSSDSTSSEDERPPVLIGLGDGTQLGVSILIYSKNTSIKTLGSKPHWPIHPPLGIVHDPAKTPAGRGISHLRQYLASSPSRRLALFDLNGVLTYGHTHVSKNFVNALALLQQKGILVAVVSTWGGDPPHALLPWYFGRETTFPNSRPGHPLRVTKGMGSLFPAEFSSILIIDDTPQKWVTWEPGTSHFPDDRVFTLDNYDNVSYLATSLFPKLSSKPGVYDSLSREQVDHLRVSTAKLKSLARKAWAKNIDDFFDLDGDFCRAVCIDRAFGAPV